MSRPVPKQNPNRPHNETTKTQFFFKNLSVHLSWSIYFWVSIKEYEVFICASPGHFFCSFGKWKNKKNVLLASAKTKNDLLVSGKIKNVLLVSGKIITVLEILEHHHAKTASFRIITVFFTKTILDAWHQITDWRAMNLWI